MKHPRTKTMGQWVVIVLALCLGVGMISCAGEDEPFVDFDCADFLTQNEAQDFFEEEGGPEEDPHDLDRDSDGLACEELP